jgi:hypothetical protein
MPQGQAIARRVIVLTWLPWHRDLPAGPLRWPCQHVLQAPLRRILLDCLKSEISPSWWPLFGAILRQALAQH